MRRAIADGQVAAGEKLPPAREVAESLGINLHTVLRGDQRLRDEGLVDLRRGRGAVLTEAATRGQATVAERATELVALARSMGFGEQDVLSLVSSAFRPGR